jgi:hypothetical protein
VVLTVEAVKPAGRNLWNQIANMFFGHGRFANFSLRNREARNKKFWLMVDMRFNARRSSEQLCVEDHHLQAKNAHI